MKFDKLYDKLYNTRDIYREVTQEEWEEDPMYLEHPKFSELKMSENADDQAFVKFCSKMFPDSPNGCIVLRFTNTEDTDELDELNEQLNKFLTSENYIVAPIDNLDDVSIETNDTLYDRIGDSKNYCNYYAAHYAHSDGWNETILMSANPAGYFAIGRFDYDKVMELAKEALAENPKLLVELAKKMHTGGAFLFNDNSGMEKFDF